MRKFNFRNLMTAAMVFVAALFIGCNTEEVDFDTPFIKLDPTLAEIPAGGGKR